MRTDEWKYVRYLHGAGGPDRRQAELYYLQSDPEETRNLSNDPRYADKVHQIQAELQRLFQTVGATPDPIPLDEGIPKHLPDPKIR